MLLYLLFWTILGFIFHFYIIIGTNLLTGGPAQNCCFFAYFSISKKRNIKRSPNGMKPSGVWFLEQTWSRGLGVQVKKQPRPPRDRRARPPVSWPPRTLFRVDSSSEKSQIFQNNSPSVFIPFDIPFLQNTEIGKKTTIWAGPPVSRLVPKMI